MLRILTVPALVSACAFAQAPPAWMPAPWKAELAPGRQMIDATFSVSAAGCSDSRVESAANRLTARLSRQTGIAMRPGRPALIIECRGAAPEYPALYENESYALDVTSAGSRLQAETATGALRGLETFAQLVRPGAEGFEAPAVHIEDHPRFPWRGLMLDVARHWLPVPVVERNLDAMAAVKLNVLHWHLADDQGFRVESLRFPRLQQAGSDGNFYTQAEVRRIVAYARERGIRVVPEFDMPGHTTSWFAGYPELASAAGPYRVERSWGIFQPTMDPSRPETYAFLDAFLGEMTALFPDPFFHIGGDEVDDAQWKRSASIQAFAREHSLGDSHELQAYFNRRVEALLKKYGKTLVGWDEALAPGLAPATVIQSWRGQQSLADAARKGYRGVLSFGYYLDHLRPASFHYQIDPLSGAAGELDREQTARILGGEACMWSEYVSAETVDSRIWPRAAAIAERLWSPKEITDVASMYARLENISRVLDWTGARHRANYGPMLVRLAGGRSVEPLEALADAVEALGIEGRRDARKYTSQVALNRLVDAARPESEAVRELERAATTAGKDPAGHQAEVAALRAAFTEWSENHALLVPLAQDNFLLSELRPLSEDLSALGAMGLRALDYLQTGRPAPATWVAEQNRRLGEMQKPKAEVTLAAARPVRILLEAAARSGVQDRAEALK
jgi:hexosaminidase